MTDYDNIQEAVQDAIRNGVHAYDSERIVTKAVVIYEALNSDGSRTLTVMPSEDMRAYDVLGFLAYAKQATCSVIDEEIKDLA